ncbi:oligoendopeptidase F [Symbiobacterium terraclitae]|uniref:oligoendopeptidase F n=1 Tax=Symbiobacterium terraclitae TaxID=557451 RepID=UPI0035B562C1
MELLKRQDVPAEHKWDLDSVYPTTQAWEEDYARVEAMVPQLTAYQGRLGESAGVLLEALRKRDELFQLLERVAVFAHMKEDEDTTNSTYQALSTRGQSLYARVTAAGSFMTPEILAIPSETIRAWLDQNPDLAAYRHELEDLLREKEHVRSPEVEELLAQMSEVGGAPRDIFGKLNHADMKFPRIKDEEGKEVELTHGRYLRFLESPVREVRKAAFDALYGTYAKFRNTLAATYSNSVKKDVVYARARRYPSARAAALSSTNVPESVYDNLIEAVHRNLPSLHRYVQLRRKLLKLDELHMYDLYTPMVAEVDKKIPYAEAVETILKALEPLGEEYCEVARKGLTTDRWVDIYENVGKRSGAYSFGAYTTKPFILMNYQETLDSMFTLAHELGHSMHSYFTRRHQPYHYGNYTIFVAEVASTFNEALLTDYLLKQTDDPKLKMYLINHQLESFRTTLYRQTMFAEFEHITHQRSEKGEALTADLLDEIYYGLNKQYYGTEGMAIDEAIALEWARIPHFYSAFYVYQYATGISAAVALSRQVLTEGKPAVDRYLTFLKSGSSDYSTNLLARAGVDMTSPEPVQQALDVFASLLDEMERLAG